MLSSVMALGSGCAHTQWPQPGAAPAGPGQGALAWWSRAVEAGPSQRDAMLKNAKQDRSAWRIAMLRSLPGSETETLSASRESLRAQLKRGLRDEEAALTRMRIAELDQAGTCHAENVALRERLNRIVEIEKQIGHER